MSFTYNIIRKDPEVVLSLYGELIDRTQSQDFVSLTESFFEEGKNRFILDLSELRYMNSSGLNLLITLLTRSRKNGGDLILCGISQKVRELLLITKLNSVFTVTDTVEEAAARFNTGS
ncbi:MAG TPA: STAS domain-containing protein [Bacteroidia bacterium]|nr:STAS domain-containing protein [Bacteroidia bacterium]